MIYLSLQLKVEGTFLQIYGIKLKEAKAQTLNAVSTINCIDDATCKYTKGFFNCTYNSGFEENGIH